MLFVVQVIRAIVAGQPRLLGAALVGALVGVLGGAAAAALVAGMLAVVDEFTSFVLGDAQTDQRSVIRQRFSYRQTFALCRAKRHTPGTSTQIARRLVLSATAVGSPEPYLAVREHIDETP